MICQSCGKRQAVTQIKTNINGVTSEYNLCPECAKKMGYQATSDFYNPFLNLNSLLGSFSERKNHRTMCSVVRCAAQPSTIFPKAERLDAPSATMYSTTSSYRRYSGFTAIPTTMARFLRECPCR